MCLIFIQTQTQGEFGWWCHRPISGGIEVQYPATLGEFLFSESSLDQNSDSSDIMIYSRADIPCRIGPFWDRVEVKCPEGSMAKGTTHGQAFDLHFKIVLFLFFLLLQLCLLVEQKFWKKLMLKCQQNNKKKQKNKIIREIKGAHWPGVCDRQEAVIFVASLKPLWPSSSLIPQCAIQGAT